MKIHHQEIARLIGVEVVAGDGHYRIIDVLCDGPSVILQRLDEIPVIQADQYGEAHRRVPRLLTIPVFLPDGAGLHPMLAPLRSLLQSD